MVSSSKVLTVSYGTFSCTVEGFDQPMLALEQAASLFHGIVQQDRFFGAKPPKLSQEQIDDLFERQIIARQDETGLILSPAPATADKIVQNREDFEQNAPQAPDKNSRFADVIQAATQDETAQDRARDIARLMDAKSEMTRNDGPDRIGSGDVSAHPSNLGTDLGTDMLADADHVADFAMDNSASDASDKAARAARAMLTENTIEDGDASRLMDAAESQFDEPAGNARRNAIAHLRAAVAATRADRQMHRRTGEDGQDPYRDDLADAVRPRRSQTSATEVADSPANAPLPLRAEQRVDDLTDDTPDTGENSFVKLGQITRPIFETASADQAQGFVDYADLMQAQSLSDLLEAAASYICLVQGEESFSRPQLMNTISQAEVHNSSREDRMRNFATLLRDEKIQRTAAGTFTVTDKTGFRATRAAG